MIKPFQFICTPELSPINQYNKTAIIIVVQGNVMVCIHKALFLNRILTLETTAQGQATNYSCSGIGFLLLRFSMLRPETLSISYNFVCVCACV